jgi:glutamine amidotransferase
MAKLRNVIAQLADEIAQYGRFNFLMCDARHLYAYCTNKLCWIQRRAPFTRAALVDADLEVDFSQHTTPRDKVVVVATRPLTRGEAWTECRPAELCVFGNGELLGIGGNGG